MNKKILFDIINGLSIFIISIFIISFILYSFKDKVKNNNNKLSNLIIKEYNIKEYKYKGYISVGDNEGVYIYDVIVGINGEVEYGLIIVIKSLNIIKEIKKGEINFILYKQDIDLLINFLNDINILLNKNKLYYENIRFFYIKDEINIECNYIGQNKNYEFIISNNKGKYIFIFDEYEFRVFIYAFLNILNK